MSGKFIVPIQLPLLDSKPDSNPAEGYYKLYLRNDKLRKMDWLGIEETVGGEIEITTTQIANWDAAYSWGNHANAGYVTLSTDQQIDGVKTFASRQYFNSGITVNDGNVEFYKSGRTQPLVSIDQDNNWMLMRFNDLTTSETNPSAVALLFRSDQGFTRTDHYGSFQGTYDVGHQYNFWYGNTTSTAGLWNINFLGTTLSNRPLMTINNGAGSGLFNTPVFKLMANGNLLLGLGTDAGQKLQVNGNVRASGYVVTSGTSSQFLKADGSLDSNTYLTSSGASGAYVSLSGSYANPSWITSLAWSKITGVPAFLTAEADTLSSVTGRGATTTSAITVGGITTTGDISPSTNNTYNLGAPSLRYANIYASSTIYTGGIRGTALNFGDEVGNNFARFFATTGNLLLQNGGTFTDNGYRLEVVGSVKLQNSAATLILNNATYSELNYGSSNYFRANGSAAVINGPYIQFLIAGSEVGRFASTTNNFLIGTTTDAGYRLDVNGTARMQGILTVTPASLTGSSATSAIDISQTWNTTGTPIAIKLNITDTASNNLSDLMSLQVAGSPKFRILKSGYFVHAVGGEINGSLIVGGNSGNLSASAMLQADSTTRGFLPPRMTTAQKTAISTPATGLVVYDSTLNSLAVYNGTLWGPLITGVGTVTASSSLAQGVYLNNTLVASANNDVLVGLDIAPTFTVGAFTGVTTAAIRVAGNIIPSVNTTYSIGTTSLRFKDLFLNGNMIASKAYMTNLNYNVTDLNIVNASDVQVAKWFGTGNLLIQNGGTFTDAGFRLDVNGTARIQNQLTTTGTITAASAIARGVYFNQTLVAAANNDVLVGLDINPTFTNGAYTGVTNMSIRFKGDIYPSADNLYSIGSGSFRIAAIWGFQSIFSYYYAPSGQSAFFGVSGNTNINFPINNTIYGRFHATTGNFTLQNGGTFTDAGYRLDVIGTARVTNDLTVEGTATATVVKKQGGTSTQFLKADGSVDNNSYATNNLSIAYAIALG